MNLHLHYKSTFTLLTDIRTDATQRITAPHSQLVKYNYVSWRCVIELLTVGHSVRPAVGTGGTVWQPATWIDVSATLPTDGVVVRWRLYCRVARLPVRLQIWRPTVGRNFRLIGETMVRPTEVGIFQVWTNLSVNSIYHKNRYFLYLEKSRCQHPTNFFSNAVNFIMYCSRIIVIIIK